MSAGRGVHSVLAEYLPVPWVYLLTEQGSGNGLIKVKSNRVHLVLGSLYLVAPSVC